MNDNDNIEAQAEEWVVKMTQAHVSEVDRQSFSEWCNLSAVHKNAYEQALKDWETLPFGEASELIPISIPEKRRQPLWQPFLYAASLALVLLGTVYTFTFETANPPETLFYQTEVGEKQELVLNDGSAITLNTNSAIEVTFKEGERNVTLKKGEVFFDVTRDRDRPFTVATYNGLVRVIGTSFSVSSFKNNRTSIVVASGEVQVSAKGRSSDKKSLKSNQAIEVNGHTLSLVKHVKASDQIAWQTGWVIFDRVPLHRVIERIQRYTADPIQINDHSSRDLLITGSFNMENPFKAISSFEHIYPIKVAQTRQGRIEISAKEK